MAVVQIALLLLENLPTLKKFNRIIPMFGLVGHYNPTTTLMHSVLSLFMSVHISKLITNKWKWAFWPFTNNWACAGWTMKAGRFIWENNPQVEGMMKQGVCFYLQGEQCLKHLQFIFHIESAHGTLHCTEMFSSGVERHDICWQMWLVRVFRRSSPQTLLSFTKKYCNYRRNIRIITLASLPVF